MQEWRKDLLSELRINLSGKLSSKHPSIANRIPDDFPDINIINLYLHPAAHVRNPSSNRPLTLLAEAPLVSHLTRFAAAHFAWGESIESLIDRFSSLLFPAMALRQAIRAACLMDKGLEVEPEARCPMLRKIERERRSRDTCFLPEVRVRLNIPTALIKEICLALPNGPRSQADMTTVESRCRKCRAWLPRAIVQHVRPDLCGALWPPSEDNNGEWYFR